MYYCNNKKINLMKNMIPSFIKEWLKLCITDNYRDRIDEIKNTKGNKRIILIGTPAHGNLGDHAIAEAEKKFFKDTMPSNKIIEILTPLYNIAKKQIVYHTANEDIIVISGGGWLGNLWQHNENLVRDIIKSFPNNLIIIFPQTVFYTNSSNAQKEIETSRKIYSAHKRLVFCLREQTSYDFVQKKGFLCNTANYLLTPDIVLYLDKATVTAERKNILLCFRQDKEQGLYTGQKCEIEEFLRQRQEDFSYTDTVLPHLLALKNRKAALEQKFNEFRHAKLIITDRLHGMLFAAITGTPCIALNNITGKVKGVYYWISHLEYIQFVETQQEFLECFDKVIGVKNCHFAKDTLVESFAQLSNKIMNV